MTEELPPQNPNPAGTPVTPEQEAAMGKETAFGAPPQNPNTAGNRITPEEAKGLEGALGAAPKTAPEQLAEATESVEKPGFVSRVGAKLSSGASTVAGKMIHNPGKSAVGLAVATVAAATLLPNQKQQVEGPDGQTTEKSKWGFLKTTAVTLGSLGTATMLGVKYAPNFMKSGLGKVSPAAFKWLQTAVLSTGPGRAV